MSIKFSFCGDVMLGENLYHYNRGIRTKYKNLYDLLIDPFIREYIFDDSDYVFFNFEFSLVEDEFNFDNIKNSLYRVDKSSLVFFPRKKSILNIANNHFSQYGKKYCKFSKEIIKKSGFFITGETCKPLVLNYEDMIVKFWGVSLIKDFNYCNEYYIADYKSIIEDLNTQLKKLFKRVNEIWIISLHWGDEYIKTPSSFQINLAHQLSELGFDYIIGHHPHVIQSIEFYNDSFICYSLGNFVFDQNFSKETQDGLLIKADLLNKKDINIYMTNQRGYKVFFKEKINIYEKKIRPVKFYFIKLKLLDLIKRIQMKIELILHFKDLDIQSIKVILSKIKRIIHFR